MQIIVESFTEVEEHPDIGPWLWCGQRTRLDDGRWTARRPGNRDAGRGQELNVGLAVKLVFVPLPFLFLTHNREKSEGVELQS